jgi:hypothetical protein
MKINYLVELQIYLAKSVRKEDLLSLGEIKKCTHYMFRFSLLYKVLLGEGRESKDTINRRYQCEKVLNNVA